MRPCGVMLARTRSTAVAHCSGGPAKPACLTRCCATVARWSASQACQHRLSRCPSIQSRNAASAKRRLPQASQAQAQASAEATVTLRAIARQPASAGMLAPVAGWLHAQRLQRGMLACHQCLSQQQGTACEARARQAHAYTLGRTNRVIAATEGAFAGLPISGVEATARRPECGADGLASPARPDASRQRESNSCSWAPSSRSREAGGTVLCAGDATFITR